MRIHLVWVRSLSVAYGARDPRTAPAIQLVGANPRDQRVLLLEHQGGPGEQRAVEPAGEAIEHIQRGVIVIPTTTAEPAALMLMEVMAMERPVVASRTGGTPEIVLDGQTGLLFSLNRLAAECR